MAADRPRGGFQGVIDVLENKCVYFDEKDNGVTMTEEEPTGDLKARQEAAYQAHGRMPGRSR